MTGVMNQHPDFWGVAYDLGYSWASGGLIIREKLY